MSSLCVKFKPSSTPPSDRFWWGVLVVLVVLVLLLVLLVTGVKQSQLLVLRLSLEFDKNLRSRLVMSNHNHVWSCIVMCGYLWSCMIAYGHIWSYKFMYCCVWSCMVIYGPERSGMVMYRL